MSGDTAIFNSFTGTITLGSSPTINTITLQGSDTLTFNGGTLNVTNFALGANDIVGGTGTITAVNLQGGTLQSGITVTSVTSTGGTIGPATIGMLSQSSGALTVTGAIGGSGTWTISGGAASPVGGSASINHAVNVSGANVNGVVNTSGVVPWAPGRSPLRALVTTTSATNYYFDLGDGANGSTQNANNVLTVNGALSDTVGNLYFNPVNAFAPTWQGTNQFYIPVATSLSAY